MGYWFWAKGYHSQVLGHRHGSRVISQWQCVEVQLKSGFTQRKQRAAYINQLPTLTIYLLLFACAYLSSFQPSPSPNIIIISSWLFLGWLLLHPIPSHSITKVKQFAVLGNLDKIFFWYVSIFISNFGRCFFIKINLNGKCWIQSAKKPQEQEFYKSEEKNTAMRDTRLPCFTDF